MQKIEKWRIQEMATALGRFADVLKQGENREWGNVFSHFQHEAQKIAQKSEFDLEALKRLISNIKGCFKGTSSLINIELTQDYPGSSERLNKELKEERLHLQHTLADLEHKAKELIN